MKLERRVNALEDRQHAADVRYRIIVGDDPDPPDLGPNDQVIRVRFVGPVGQVHE